MFATKFLCSAKGLWITCYFLPFSWEYLITILVAGKLPPGLVVNVEDSQSEPLSLDVGWIPAMRPIIGLFTTYTIAESPKRNFEFLSFFTKNVGFSRHCESEPWSMDVGWIPASP